MWLVISGLDIIGHKINMEQVLGNQGSLGRLTFQVPIGLSRPQDVQIYFYGYTKPVGISLSLSH